MIKNQFSKNEISLPHIAIWLCFSFLFAIVFREGGIITVFNIIGFGFGVLFGILVLSLLFMAIVKINVALWNLILEELRP